MRCFNIFQMVKYQSFGLASASRWQSRRTCTHLLQEHWILKELLKTIHRRTLEPTQKRYPTSKAKEETATRQRRCSITIKINPIPARWETEKLKNSNTKKFLPLLWMFWALCQASKPTDLAKGLGIPKESDSEGQWDLITGLPQDCWKKTPFSKGTNKILSAPWPSGKEQWPHSVPNQAYLLKVESPVEVGQQGLAVGARALAAAILEGAPWHESPGGFRKSHFSH